jgi:hypothetical protein
MSACTNCGNQMSCGCQRRTASDGSSVCSSCLASYEVKLKNNVEKKQETVQPQNNTWGKDRYRNLNKFVK